FWQSGAIYPWQPGAIYPTFQYPPNYFGAELPPTAEFYSASVALWSSDGRFLVQDLRLTGILALAPGVSVHQLDACGQIELHAACESGTLPYPDPALKAVEEKAALGVQFGPPSGQFALTQWSPIPLAWRLDGKVLAARIPSGSTSEGAGAQDLKAHIALYDTRTGELIAKLAAERTTAHDQRFSAVRPPPLARSP